MHNFEESAGRFRRTVYRAGVIWLFVSLVADAVVGFGAMSSIAASFGEEGMFCAIEASAEQQVMCWGRNSTSPTADAASGPSLAALSGGGGFMCGLKTATFQPFCWRKNQTGTNIVPPRNQNRQYSQIAAGENHVCGIRRFSDAHPGAVDCWAVRRTGKDWSFAPPMGLVLESVVAGSGFTCGLKPGGLAVCWGLPSLRFDLTPPAEDRFEHLASGRSHVCGIRKKTAEVKCWGDDSLNQGKAPEKMKFVDLAGGYGHSCGIRQDNHGIECWGSFNRSSIPRGAGFLAIASSNVVTCGVREDNLILDCWGNASDYAPPLQLCSPGLCSSEPCGNGEFFFNASVLGVMDLTSLCVRAQDWICSPCARDCPDGFFLSSPCTKNADRVCAACSLCQNSSCQGVCAAGPHGPLSAFPPLNSEEQRQTSMAEQRQRQMNLVAILGASISGGFLLALIGLFVPCLLRGRRRRRRRSGQNRCFFCIGQSDTETEPHPNPHAPSAGIAAPWLTTHDLIRMQAFRLAELRDATNGFKELNELGRGSYGFVYKATLQDGRQVAVKRANAARRIHSNSRDFESELEILCKLRHGNLVNLLGYCEEMGERLLVYEFMPHGTLHDHLHGGLSPLSWNLRLKISMQAARGIEYLHKDALPPIVHRDIKASNILLDAEWGARVADFGLTLSGEKGLPFPVQQGDAVYIDPDYYKSQNFTEKSDVYSFGVVLLEILSGRKAYDSDFDPPNIVEWAAPLISQGKAETILDRNVDLPRNVEPLLRMADVAELSVRPDPNERPTMSDVAAWLEQLAKSSSL